MRVFTILCFIGLMISGLSAQEIPDKIVPSSLDSMYAPVKFRSIGPFRGGRSVTATGVIGDPLTYYMGTTGGGLWKTDDAGQLWKNISDGYFRTGSVGAVAVSESDPNVVYCGMGEHAPRGVMTSYGDGVYKSIDAGKTWMRLGLEETQQIARIVIHPTNPDIVYVAAQGKLNTESEERGVYKSTDGGTTWKKVLYVDEKTGCSELSMDMNHPHILYAAMWEHKRLPWKVISGGPGSGLYKSTDGGETWTEMKKGLPEEKGKMAIAVCRSNSNRVYALIESDSKQEKGGLFVSTNAGNSWTRVSGDHRLIQRAWYYIEVFPDPKDEHTVYVMSAPALRSIDGGKTWERITGTHGDFHDLWINPHNTNNLCIANDGGAAISFNHGKTWSTQANMPTAQFYRVTVDNQEPYRIYGGQQDNTSVVIMSRAPGGRGITERHWDASAGGESAFLAFDPDNPRYVLGGSYLGTIEILDVETRASTNIMAAPIQYLGRAASDMKYRFNWNAPIIKSQHEPNTFYHAAQMLLRTRDMGQTWEEASPDLSKNEKDKQIKGGGPYTVEAVGAENYGTISYVAESPHEAGVIWVATDDGHVQLTRDNCKTWTNVTPSGLEECLVNAIDISPHNPGTAYIATTRYKFNDQAPALYKTTNYGRSWTNITEGIPYGAFTRVVREDDVRKDLLFAGTETGLYVSWNGGRQWHPFQLNLPVTPILDLIIKHGDVIVATSGRSFWVLDDLGLIRQHNDSNEGLKLFYPEETVLRNGSSELNSSSPSVTGTNPLRGVNPANGMVLYYHIPDGKKAKDLRLEIKDAQGRLVRTLRAKKDSTYKRWDGGPPPAPTLSAKSGLNRFVWDLRHEIMEGVPGVYIEASYRGHKIVPGTYTLTLFNGDQTSSVNAVVISDPGYQISPAQFAEYDLFMTNAENAYNEMHRMVNKIYKMKKRLGETVKNNPSSLSMETKTKAKELIAKMKSWDEDMIQRLSKAYDDVENFENKFTANYAFMINHAESSIPRVTQPSIDRKAELDAKWTDLKARGMEIIEKDVPQINQQLWEAGIGAIH